VIADAIWRRRADVLQRRSLDAVVLLPVEGDAPLALAGSAPEVWELLAEPRTSAALASTLADRHGVPIAEIEADVVPTIERLTEARALERFDPQTGLVG
jgi:hypothetical protein